MSVPICNFTWTKWGCKLLTPVSLTRYTADEIEGMGYGCGPGRFGDMVVPDTIWGLDVRYVCFLHDYMYSTAKTREDEQYADAIFGANMISIINQKTQFWILKWLRLRRAYKYIDAVTMTNVLDVATLQAVGMEDFT